MKKSQIIALLAAALVIIAGAIFLRVSLADNAQEITTTAAATTAAYTKMNY